MTLREIYSAAHGHSFKLGRKRPVAVGPRMKLARYLLSAIPTPPPSTNYGAKAAYSLAKVYLNDKYGCCVIAGMAHLVGVETANAGPEWLASDAQIIADYHAIGGFDPAHPDTTDNGCNEDTALAYYQNHGCPNGTKLLGSLALDATNKLEVMQSIALFGNAILCAELPAQYVEPFPSGSGFVWDVVGPPVPDNGHSFTAYDYDATGVKIVSWGMHGTMTWAALAKYCVRSAGGSLNVVLTPDQLTKGQTVAPNGVNWSALIADFDALGGHVPIPAPPPLPPPVPATTATMTLGVAQLCAIDLLNKGPSVLTKAQALKLVCDSLALHWPKQ